MRDLILKLFLLFSCIGMHPVTFSQHNHAHSNQPAGPLKYIANNGQWQSDILFKTDVANGAVFLEKGGFTFAQYSHEDLEKRHEILHEKSDLAENFVLHGHAWKTIFVDAKLDSKVSGNKKRREYYNYFLGNDESKWAGEVPLFEETNYASLYDKIDLKVYSQDGNFKYDFIVKPEGNPTKIQIKYDGIENLYLEKGNLILTTSVGVFKEMAPYAYQIVDGQRKTVDCQYLLNGSNVSFTFPKGYDRALDLIIDPVLIAATLSGTSGFEQNYGHCSTFDNAGNIYTGAINFDTGYPTTVGAFQTINGGGTNDIAVSKLNPTGTNLIYATYVGGLDDEFPHSLIVNSLGELFIYGTTYSSNYPVTLGAYDNTLGGFTDMVITRLNASGSALIGSTFIGGSDVDGTNTLTINYGDNFRGEIILDAVGNCYIAGTTSSSNFPTSPGAYQTGFGGITDAVFFKMNANLTSLIWSTLLGGADEESGFGLRLDAAGDVYACGAGYGNFMIANGFQTTSGGQADGFVVKITANGTTMPNRTYFGTPFADNAFFIDIDNLGRINIYGQCDGTFLTPTPGTYGVAGSHQYIACFNPTLTTPNFLSLIGSGGGGSEFVPIAFMVDNCGYIYFSGHSVATSTLVNTAGAFQTSGGFYLGVLSPNATSMHFATHYGGPGDHVDGGTSRFDPSGTVYQAVCTNNGFNTTAGAYSPTYPGGYDIGVFKINFEVNTLQASATLTPSTIGCAPLTINFNNTSSGVNWLWDFGDGSPTTTVTSPTHTYSTAGTYNVMLVANDPSSCVTADTAYFLVEVLSTPNLDLGPDTTLCPGTTITLDAGAGVTPYLWQDASTNQTFTVTTAGTYFVTVGSGICTASDTIVIAFGGITVNLGPDDVICSGGTLTLDAGNPGATYLWSDLSTAQTLTVSTAGTYSVDVTLGTCTGSDAISILTDNPVPSFSVADTVGCSPVITQFTDLSTSTSPIINRLWDFGDGGTSLNSNPTHSYSSSGNYLVTLTITTAAGCTEVYSRNVTIQVSPQPIASFSFTPNNPNSNDEVAFIDHSVNALSWYWSFGDGNLSTAQNPSHLYETIEEFNVMLVVTNANCTDTARANISVLEEILFYVPNAFTPNRDERNNTFQPVFTGGFNPFNFNLSIYNRWGELVFESEDANVGWDGTINNKLAQDGVYTWKIYYSRKYNDDKNIVVGHVSILR